MSGDKTVPLLRTSGLTKHYKVRFQGAHSIVRAVEDVSLEIEAGRSLALIGESGSGKTTFGKLIAALEEPTSGSVIFDGNDLASLGRSDRRMLRRDLQMVFQSSKEMFDPDYTVGESIREVLENYTDLSRKDADDAVVEILEKVGLEGKAAAMYARELSGGQCQRANIARALVLRPRLVICDEPVSSLDFSIRRQTLDFLRRMQEEFGLTYLLITHDLSNVPYICQAIAIMYRGKVVEYMESVDGIEARSAHPYTKLLYESIPVDDPRKRTEGRGRIQVYERTEDVTAGCPFQKRCSKCFGRCTEEEPVLRPIDGGHMVACHMFDA